MLNLSNLEEHIKKAQCPDFLRWLMAQIAPQDSILDIGCGDKWYHPFLDYKSIITVDAWEKSNPDYIIDLGKQSLPFFDKEFDVVLMLDFIEHLEKDAGAAVLEQAQRMARKKLILLTPLDFDKNEIIDKVGWYQGNPYVVHKSLWGAGDFIGWEQIFLSCFASPNKRYFLGVWKNNDT